MLDNNSEPRNACPDSAHKAVIYFVVLLPDRAILNGQGATYNTEQADAIRSQPPPNAITVRDTTITHTSACPMNISSPDKLLFPRLSRWLRTLCHHYK